MKDLADRRTRSTRRHCAVEWLTSRSVPHSSNGIAGAIDAFAGALDVSAVLASCIRDVSCDAHAQEDRTRA